MNFMTHELAILFSLSLLYSRKREMERIHQFWKELRNRLNGYPIDLFLSDIYWNDLYAICVFILIINNFYRISMEGWKINECIQKRPVLFITHYDPTDFGVYTLTRLSQTLLYAAMETYAECPSKAIYSNGMSSSETQDLKK